MKDASNPPYGWGEVRVDSWSKYLDLLGGGPSSSGISVVSVYYLCKGKI